MQSDFQLRKIIWAVDPFVTDPHSQIQTARAIRTLTKGLEVEVEPVCVLTHRHLEIPVRSYANDELVSGGGPRVQEMMSPQEALKQWAGAVELSNMLEPICLPLETHSLHRSVLELVDYAKQTKADLIAVSTRAREGVSRFMMGSFAESLTSQSPIPLFVVNPNLEVTTKYKEILFPTGASEASKKGFEKVLSLASKIGASITIFHKLEFLVEYESFKETRHEVAKIKSELHRWKEDADKAGVKCEILIVEKPGNIAESILKYSDGTRSELIAMEAMEGTAVSALFGSVTRQVTRHADCPVLVFHPERN
jgi:nucleotide-binding universal stress UspA family protein